jgi:hypothetical protein
MEWRRGIVVIECAYRTEDPGFESRQGVRYLGFYALQCCCHYLVCIVIVCTLRKINAKKVMTMTSNASSTFFNKT